MEELNAVLEFIISLCESGRRLPKENKKKTQQAVQKKKKHLNVRVDFFFLRRRKLSLSSSEAPSVPCFFSVE